MRDVLRNRWWVVAASVCGLIVGAGPINVFAFGVFLKPITAELGVGRGLFSSALTLHSLIGAFACPAFGWLIDRWGVRRVMIPGLLLFALATASFALIQASPFVVTYLIFAIAGLITPVQGPIPYATVTAQWFDRQRGLALGIAMAGVGLGVALVPQLAALLIGAFGWRLAYVGLAIAVMVVAFVPVVLFVREPPELARRARRQPASARTVLLPGDSAGRALRSGLFWALSAAFLLDVVAINGTLTHIVALLTDRGIPSAFATAALSGSGIALLLGRVLSGWCLDRLWGPYVAVAFFATPMIGIALLASQAGGFVPFLGAVACGLGIGAEVDLMAFFASRYFGLRDYAKIYGTMFGLFGLGVGIGPALSGTSFDLYHSYTPIFVIYEIMLAISCIIFLRLGPYPYPPQEQAPTSAELELPA
ncbi:MAG: MFS transporter [Alphaproteobacteria bacterium]|nr:MFS transporter [Alphaproteobacteria bacterium]MBV9861444.1 MFS transporter [Alphaproteobacteria bacterium]